MLKRSEGHETAQILIGEPPGSLGFGDAESDEG